MRSCTRHRLTPRAHARRDLLATLGLVFLFAACEAELPTSAELEEMTVADVEDVLARLHIAPTDDVRYLIDGVPADAQAAHALLASEYSEVQISRLPPGDDGAPGPTVLAIVTLAEADRRWIEEGIGWTMFDPAQGLPEPPERTLEPTPDVDVSESFSGLLLINGRRAEPWALRFLTPGAIERVEVIKGAAASLRYTDPAARNGVILISTRTPKD